MVFYINLQTICYEEIFDSFIIHTLQLLEIE